MQRPRLPFLRPIARKGRSIAALVIAASAAVPVPYGRAVAQEGVQGAEVILARASRRKPKSSALPPGMQQAVPLAVFGDWNVFTNGAQAREKLCYVIAQPTARSPKTLARDTGYLFVTFPKGGGQGEIAVMLGFKPRPAAAQAKPGAAAAPSDPYLTVGNTRYGLVVKDENAWIQNQADEPRIVTELSRAQTATVRTTSQRGNTTQDDYALGGFADALKRAREECK
ncbi:invasion associated locus b family protein [Methylorubrum populi]|uniref:Mlr4354-like protein n=1 Tax=Methylorubrum populi TaxID=223967 RepID=A0A833J6S4_9HYPH|nr:invasion associated locus b family protein [Methylorubrum populi]KAB7785284.1 Mlr4354-like protein [Methylorubrum populi]